MKLAAERSYEKTVSSAELAPDDYLIQPFAIMVILDIAARSKPAMNC